MCGIVGHARARPEALPDRRAAHAAIALIKHRGPDDEGIFEGPGIFLGHTRLAITGILRGHQPVANRTGRVQVVFNGEIYNHRELRRELEARGYRIEGESDSAILPHAYEEWGAAFVERLEGIFAIALWDGGARRLVLCRDRFGVKPLYYAHDSDGLSFGSELKAVAVARTSEPEVDPAALGDYLAFGYVPGPRTMLRGILALPPATMLTWQDGDCSSRLYWTPDFSAAASGDEREAIRRIETALDTAVRRECVTETPVGAFLSGGLDSSAIVALMAETLRRPFDTFHVGFDEASFGEQDWAREVSAHFGTRHREIRCTAGDVERLLPSLVWHLDNPAADVSALAEFMVADLAKDAVKVVLSGDGGDEVLAGYPTYKADRVADLIVGAGLRRPAAWGLGLVEPFMPGRSRKLGAAEKIHRLRLGLSAAGGHPHVRWRTVFAEASREDLLAPGARPYLEDTWGRALAWLDGTEGWPPLTRFQWLDMRVWLDGCVLRKVDALAMAHAIEVRVPFLDHRVVEAALGAAPSVRLRGWTEKYALRRMMVGRLPERIRRRPKAPFQVPLHDWFRGPLAALAREHFTSGGLIHLDMVSPASALRVLDRHGTGEEPAGVKLWALLVLSAWMTHCFARLRELRARPVDAPAFTGGGAVSGAPVSFVIPAFNEEAAIPVVLESIQRVAKEHGIQAEYIVVDDGSTDQTAAVAATHGARVISIPMNVGYGTALKRGIEAAANSRIVITDADGSYPMDYTPELLKRLERFDLVIGRRTGTTYYRSLLTYPFRLAYLLLVWFVVGRRVPDPNSGFRAFRREAVEEFLPVMCAGFSFSTSMTTLFLLSGLTVDYVAIPYHRRIGKSKIRFVRDMLRTGQILCSVILLYNPIKLFVLLSGATVLIGAGLILAALLTGGGQAFWLPGVLCVLFSGVFFCFGLLADLMANSRKRL